MSGKKYKRTDLAAALYRGRLTEPMQYEGTMDGELFEVWLRKFLCPSLEFGSTLIMDNASFHSKKKGESIASSLGHRVIFLPPHSPELNPIERYWAALKKLLKGVIDSVASIDDALRICLQVK
nr:transposase [uncultured Cloacibacillus sp.]